MKDRTRVGVSGLTIFLGVIVLLIVVPFIVYGISLLTADTRGKTDVREKTVANGNYRIANYDSFYDQCGAIQSNEAKQRTARAQIKQAKGAEEKQRATVNLQAMQNTHADLATSYNSDASKAGTAGQFKASDLPFNIDPTATKGTTCAR